MTNEQAIEILKAHHMWTGEPQEIIDVRKENKALDMAIQALSQKPCDDVVSRQAVINAIENDCMKGGLGSCFACYNDAQVFRGEIEKLPSVTLQQDTVPFDFELYQAGLMDMPKEMIEVLEQIRAEIEGDMLFYEEDNCNDKDTGFVMGLQHTLDIIDKYTK